LLSPGAPGVTRRSVVFLALPEFDQLLASINEEQGHRISLDCVGPLPPYSFVDLES